MVFKKCPGQDLSRKKIEEVVCDIPCPFCGAGVEFFFDDRSRRCASCGTVVSKNDIQVLRDFGCADWCKSAEKCIGSELFGKLLAAKKENSKK
ncbi:MAG: hypothetical protein JXB23_04770 [Candidatus Aminicenantes bacterium]|nr:hypothetical protein [Candidatus Aminicenantes bacterium]